MTTEVEHEPVPWSDPLPPGEAGARSAYRELKAWFSTAATGVVVQFKWAGNASECLVTRKARQCRVHCFDANGAGFVAFDDDVALAERGSGSVAMTPRPLAFADMRAPVDLWLAGATGEELQRQCPAVRLVRFAGARTLLSYFEHMERDRPDEPHWRNGSAVCRRWLGLLAEGATQTDVDQMMKQLNAPEPSSGSGWYDLQLQFSHWARSRGFRT